MQTFFEQIYTILTVPPGNLAYHLVLALSIAGALQNALFERARRGDAATRRLFAGLLLLIIGQLAMFLAGGLAWQGIADSHTLLPPLDRAVAFISLVVILWLWAFHLPVAWQDVLCGFLVLLAAIGLGLSLNSWAAASPDQPFNSSWLGWAWEVASLAVCLGSLLFLVLRRPPAWGLGTGLFAVLVVGYAAQRILRPADGDYPGLIRLAQFAAFPLLLALPHRLHLSAGPAHDAAISPSLELPGSPRYALDPVTLETIFALASLQKGELDPAGISRAVAQLVNADRCYLAARSSPGGGLDILGGFDSVQNANLPGFHVDAGSANLLAQVLENDTFLQLDPGSPAADQLNGLAQAMDLPQYTSLLFIPVGLSGQPATGALILVSTASARDWTVEDQEYLAPVVSFLSGIFTRTDEPAPSQEVEKVSSEASSAWQKEDLPAGNDLPHADFSPANRADEARKDLIEVIALQEELQTAMARLQQENEKLKEAVGQANRQVGIKTSQVIQRESALQSALAEMERLRGKISQLENAYLDLRSGGPSENLARTVELIVKELHQPADSIAGYADLLLGESMGTVGPLQRKFLDRIKSAAGKMGSLLDELSQAIHQAEQGPVQSPQIFDLRKVLESACEDTNAQRAEKNITLDPDFPEDWAPFAGEPNAIQRIAIHLLRNAAAVTPEAGTITLNAARIQDDRSDPSLVVQVTDTGGGVRVEDLPAVFSPELRAGPIAGIGDNGVDLSIAKAIANSLGGRIWIESSVPGSSIVSVLIPVKDPGATIDQPVESESA